MLAAGYLETQQPFRSAGRGSPATTASLRYNPATEWTGGGLISNPQDLVRWATLLYEGRAIEAST